MHDQLRTTPSQPSLASPVCLGCPPSCRTISAACAGWSPAVRTAAASTRLRGSTTSVSGLSKTRTRVWSACQKNVEPHQHSDWGLSSPSLSGKTVVHLYTKQMTMQIGINIRTHFCHTGTSRTLRHVTNLRRDARTTDGTGTCCSDNLPFKLVVRSAAKKRAKAPSSLRSFQGACFQTRTCKDQKRRRLLQSFITHVLITKSSACACTCLRRAANSAGLGGAGRSTGELRLRFLAARSSSTSLPTSPCRRQASHHPTRPSPHCQRHPHWGEMEAATELALAPAQAQPVFQPHRLPLFVPKLWQAFTHTKKFLAFRILDQPI